MRASSCSPGSKYLTHRPTCCEPLDMVDAQGVSSDRLYQEAMLTFRAVMTSSVSTATALFGGSLAALGFAVNDDGDVYGRLVLLAAAPLVTMSVLFIGWWTFNQQASEAAKTVLLPKPSNGHDLHTDLGDRPRCSCLLAYTCLRWVNQCLGSGEVQDRNLACLHTSFQRTLVERLFRIQYCNAANLVVPKLTYSVNFSYHKCQGVRLGTQQGATRMTNEKRTAPSKDQSRCHDHKQTFRSVSERGLS